MSDERRARRRSYLSFTIENNIDHHTAFRRQEVVRTGTTDETTFLDPHFEMTPDSKGRKGDELEPGC